MSEDNKDVPTLTPTNTDHIMESPLAANDSQNEQIEWSDTAKNEENATDPPEKDKDETHTVNVNGTHPVDQKDETTETQIDDSSDNGDKSNPLPSTENGENTQHEQTPETEEEQRSENEAPMEKQNETTDCAKEKSMETMEVQEKNKDTEKGSPPSPPIPMTKFKIIKNLAVVSVGFFCLFTAFISISNLQTSLNIDDGVGPGSLSIVYGALVLSCMFVPPFMIAHLGCKWTIPLSMIGYVLYMGANMHAIWPLMAPAAALLGLGAAPLWSAKCTYLTQTGVWYAQWTGQSKDAIINRFFGVFFMTFQASQISGNLVSSLIFRQSDHHLNASTEVLLRCGANFDPRIPTNNTNLERPDEEKVHIVCGVYLAFAVLAAIIVSLLLDKLPVEKDKGAKPSLRLLISTFRHLASSPAQMLLIPLTIYSGLEQAFFAGDFTRSYVTCSLGIWNVGYVAICYGVVDAACCYTFGRLVQYIGHIPFFILAAFLHGGVQVVLLLWTPDPNMIYVYYILAGLWGMGDAVIQTQLNALYGLLFTDNTEPAFANYRLWESVGFIFSFAYNDYIPTYIKLYVCMSVLTVGMAGYAAVEFLQRKKSSKSYDISD